MRATAQLLSLGVIAVVVLLVGVGCVAAKDDLATRPREGRRELTPHPLYESLHSDNRRVLTFGDAEDLPNYVDDGEEEEQQQQEENGEINYGDSVDGYNLADSYSSAPSYADPTLLFAVMSQADEANFRYPIVTTVPPVADMSVADSAVEPSLALPETNDINPFLLFPPQFHDLLNIPLHTYANGSTFNPHSRFRPRPLGPQISKGYANTKIQGGNKVRTPTVQNTPHVAYNHNPVYGEKTNETPSTTTRSSTITPSPPPTTTTPPPTTTTTSTTTTTTTPSTPASTTTEIPRRRIYESPPPRTTFSPATSRLPTVYTYPTLPPYSEPSNSRLPPTISNPPYRPPLSRPRPTESVVRIQDTTAREEEYRPTIPDNLPPLRYTRRPTTIFTTTRYYTTPRPTTLPPITPWPTTPRIITRPTSQSTTQQPNYPSEIYTGTERPASVQVHRRQPYGTRIPSRAPSATPASANVLNSLSFNQLQPKPVVQSNPTTRPQFTNIEEKEDTETFHPSKLDPFLRHRPSSASEKKPEYFNFNSPDVLPPVVNTYEVTTNVANRPGPANIPSGPVNSRPSLPPPPKPPSRPFLPPPPLPAGRPSLPPPPLNPNFSFVSPPYPYVTHQSLVPPPPPSERPTLSSPSHAVHNEHFNNGIYKPQQSQPPPDPPAPFSRRPVERPTLPASFGPPPRQPIPPRPRPGPAQFSGHAKPQRNQNPRLRPQNRPRPPFQIVHPVVTPPPQPQDIIEHPEPGFTLPVEAGNLPKRPTQNNEVAPPQFKSNGPNVLPQFRPNAPPQHETFGFDDPSERVFNTRPRPLRPDKRPVLTKRPSFLENFTFFRRSPVNRRLGETGPLSEINYAGDKMPTKQRTADTAAALRYQLSHGPRPKNAQKVVVIGPFKQPPPGAPIITLSSKDVPPPVAPSNIPFTPPPPPSLPSRRDTVPPRMSQESNPHSRVDIAQQSHISKKGYFDQTAEHTVFNQFPSKTLVPKPLVDPSGSPKDPIKKIGKDVVYGQPFSTQTKNTGDASMLQSAPVPSVDRTLDSPIVVPATNSVEEVSEEHKEAIIAGRFRLPSMSGIERSGAGDDNALPQNFIPLPVPILPQQLYSSQRVSQPKWSILGFGNAKPKPSPAEQRVIVDPPHIQRTPVSPSKTNLLQSSPQASPSFAHSRNQLRPIKPGSRRPYPSRPYQPIYDAPATYILPPPPANFSNPNPPKKVDSNNNLVHQIKNPLPSSTPPTITPPSDAITFIPYSATAKTTQFTEPRPVYRHTSTTQMPTTTQRPITTTTRKPPSTTFKTTSSAPIRAPTTSQPVTPMRITEYNPYLDYTKNVNEDSSGGGFKAPLIKSSDYDGWRVVGVPPTPSEGPGDALSPVVSYVKENTPEIIIRAPTISVEDDDIVTGVISDRMGEAADDQLVHYSSRFKVETPGVVRSYWVKSPTLV